MTLMTVNRSGSLETVQSSLRRCETVRRASSTGRCKCDKARRRSTTLTFLQTPLAAAPFIFMFSPKSI
jgi:hypothetical protein